MARSRKRDDDSDFVVEIPGEDPRGYRGEGTALSFAITTAQRRRAEEITVAVRDVNGDAVFAVVNRGSVTRILRGHEARDAAPSGVALEVPPRPTTDEEIAALPIVPPELLAVKGARAPAAPARSDDGRFVIDMPGAFHAFFDGTGLAQGDRWSDDDEEELDAEALREAWRNRQTIKRGRGYSLRLVVPSAGAVAILRDYAETCVASNRGSGEPNGTEITAANILIARCDAAVGQRNP